MDADGTSNATDVVGETADTYVPVGADVGKKLRVKVSFTDDAGGDEELTSDAYPSNGTIAAAPNAAPAFTSSAAFDAAENQTAVGTVTATDSDDSVTGYTIAGGADQAAFSIVALTGVLTFTAAPNFEAPTDGGGNNTYEVEVRATSGTGARVKTADQPITVTVTDVAGEAPGVPAKPTVTSASVTSVTVTWAAPSNPGPAITSYDLQYRIMGTSGDFTVGPQDVSGPSEPIPGLAEDTEYEVQVRATNAEGDSGWSEAGSGSTDANAAPAFTSSATFTAAENQTAVGTVTATDSDDDSVTGYTIAGGADQAAFSIVALTGVLTFTAAPNFEAPTDGGGNNTYEVEVRATSGTDARVKTADQPITVTVTNEAGEAPGVPAKPTVTSASVTSVTVTWAAPSNPGPAITSYDLQYRIMGTSGDFTVGPQDVSGPSEPIPGLAEDTEYEVQVRATNAEGDSDWSEAGSGSTDANAAPAFTSSATFTAAENQTAVGTVTATDSDGDSVTGYTIAGGADQAAFSIVALTGVLTFTAAPNFEAPTDGGGNNTYEVEVRATSGTGARVKTADQPITVTVTDVAGEAPGVPAKPTVTSASVTSVTVTWAAPSNEGPAITSYDLQYRIMGTSGDFTVGPQDVSGPSEPIPGLAEDTEYEVQVRATNAEGDSGWSEAGSGSTDANAAPAFTSSATFTAAENQTAVGTVTATDSDDSVTGYTIAGGADQAAFSIVALTGVLTFTAAPNFEAPTDGGGNNTYEVEVRATSGTGARVKTADQPITVTVTNEAGEAPGVPAKPTVTSASVTSVTVTWAAPSNEGPAITSYDLQYRIMGTSGDFTVGPQDVSGPSEPIPGLAEDTEYEVQVRATNAEGDSGWSEAGSGSTDANAAPAFTSSATFTAAENQTAVGTVTATDSDDSVTGYTIAGGADQAAFSIVALTGVLTFTAAPNFEAPTDGGGNNTYEVEVRATSGTDARVKTVDQPITVTVTNEAGEAPGVPAKPTVTSASVTSVTVTWAAPSNPGPAITSYDLQYRIMGTSGDFTVGPQDVSGPSEPIPGLAEDTEYEVQVRATNAEGDSGWSEAGSGSTDANAAPAFTSSATFTAAENQTAVGTVTATDSDGDSVTGYTIAGGADQAAFSIVAATGVLTFTAAPNFEAPTDGGGNNTYEVEVRATSGTDARVKTVDQPITVTVTNEAGEAPGVPAKPTVTSASVTSVTVTWAAPSNPGPAITSYDLQYRIMGTSGDFTVGPQDVSGPSEPIPGLAEDTEYEVQVRATNAEGDSGWSEAGSGSTDANAAPAFTSSATFTAAENQTAVGTVTATDSDGDSVTGYTIAGGADQAAFSIVALTGVLTFTAAPNFEAPTDGGGNNTYEVEVRATSGTDARVKTVDQPITVTVTNEAGEAPGVPAKPTVTSASVTSVTVTWAAPSNPGPAITSYDLQYRIMGTSGDFTVGPQDVSGPSEPIPGLAEDTEYEVQVRATNAEGDSGWSEAGSGSTDANAAPAFTSSATFTAAENQTAVGTVTATDSDGDSVTGYTIAGGADQAAFSIVALTGVLTFTAAPNFEAPTDGGGNNTYEVEVRATSGTDARVKTVDQPITVTVTNEAGEAPGVPAKPTVTSASVTSVTVTWAAPSNPGPAITSYDLQYRIMGTSGDFTVGPQDVSGPSEPIPGLAEDTEYEVQVRATNAEGDSGWSEAGSGSTDANAAPAFTSSATFTAAENQTAVGTVTATDSDDSVTGYTIAGGADQAAFSIVALTGVLTFTAAPNFEAPTDGGGNNTYEVEVRATSGTDARVKTVDQPITVTVTDVAGEAPGVPAKPTVTSASVTSVTVTWAAPSNPGPAITSYDLQYRIMGTSGDFTVGPQDVSGPSEPIPGLAEDTEYEVQVRATNAEGDSGWSEAGSGSTDANAAPAFTSSATFTAAENQTAVGTVTATDSDDSVTGYTIAGGADQAAFSIVALTGVLTFTAAPNFEAPTDGGGNNTYEVEVRATSGTDARVKTVDQPITVTVTNEAGEAPGVPAKPTVTSASVTSVTVTWAAPSNPGPAITSYDLQYRIMGTSGDFTVGPQDVSGPSEPIPGLAEDTEYEVQVRATNAEGDSDWSEAGSGSTDANAAPAFTSSATFTAAENQTAVGTVTATDSDGDSVTGYTIAGGADQAAFSIVVLDRGADVHGGAELRGPDGRRRQQHVRGGGAGDQRHGRAGEDGGPADHGDGDGRGRRGAGRAGQADGDVGFGDECDGDLGCALEPRAGDHELRPAIPHHGHQRGLHRRPAGRERAERADPGACGGHGVRGAGAGHQRRGRQRLVGGGERFDGRQRGAGVHLVRDVRPRRRTRPRWGRSRRRTATATA